jgi:hypothetical protein
VSNKQRLEAIGIPNPRQKLTQILQIHLLINLSETNFRSEYYLLKTEQGSLSAAAASPKHAIKMHLGALRILASDETNPEIGEDIATLHIFCPQLDLAEGLVLVLLQISQ